jgi:hypothetical protein
LRLTPRDGTHQKSEGCGSPEGTCHLRFHGSVND